MKRFAGALGLLAAVALIGYGGVVWNYNYNLAAGFEVYIAILPGVALMGFGAVVALLSLILMSLPDRRSE